MLTFYEEPFSHWCVKAKKILDYKKIKYADKRVGYHDKRELIKATGQDYVPALVSDSQVITYSNVPDFLEELQPSPTIYPNGTKALAKALENWAHYRLEDVVWRFAVTDFPKTFKDDLERWVFVEIQELKRGPLELMAVRRPEFRSEMETHLQIVDDMLQGHSFLLDANPSLADFAVYGAISPLAYSGNKIPEKFSKLRSWQESIDRV
jgi:glutathione S-transferase